MSFTHLQVRSGYSFMKSTITIDKLAEKAREQQFEALALTDEHVLYGTVPFYKACQKNGIKPIIGMHVKVDTTGSEPDLCLLLAKTNQGYQNLIRLSTHIQLSQKKRISSAALASFSGDLICIVTAFESNIGSLLLNASFDEVSSYLADYWHMFAESDFYLGVQDHGIPKERLLSQSMKAFQKTYQTKAVLLNDVRYLNEKDAAAYDCLRAMKHNETWPLQITDEAIKQRHLRSAAEMEQLYGDEWPEIIQETVNISEKCHVTMNFEKRMLPSFPVPAGVDAHTYLEQLCWENVKKRYTAVSSSVENRLAYELETIQSMQFSDYFLIVWDFIKYAKEQGISVGPGRGSAAGSLVAYVLGITEVDPMAHHLLFERFLNPERVTMPDIDVDFSDHRRDEVIDYVRGKYGDDHVAQIITFGTFAARSLLRELIKTLAVDRQDAAFILKYIPVQAKQPISAYIQESEELQRYIRQSNKLKLLFTIAAKLEGLPKHMATHAAGVVISEEPLIHHVPLTSGAHETNLTQYAMNDLESLGLLKMDFLGLRNLTLLERVLQTIRYNGQGTVTLEDIPEDDRATYAMLQEGRTNGVFQLESQGMKQVLQRLKPTRFGDIVAVNALYRPGPMDNIPIYIKRKHGREAVDYPHPDLEPILKETYGVLIYQEQIMQIAHQIAGFSLEQADILRRAISKKQQQVMNEQKMAFIQGCLTQGYSDAIAREIFQWIVKFSDYGFNKSHAVAYSKLAYQLAYLKAHYPKSFFAELLSSTGGQQDKLNLYIKELNKLELALAPPSINNSFGKYSVESQQIRMGFMAIKGIGYQVINEIIHVRRNGVFKSLFNFCLRVSLTIMNRRTMETLIMAGAFDELHANRASLLASLDQAMEQGELFKEFSSQTDLFQDKLDLEEQYVAIDDFSLMKKLRDEKELLGQFVSSHPLSQYRAMLRKAGYAAMEDAPKHTGQRYAKGAAILQTIKPIRTRRGDPMAFLTIGDETDDMEAVVFPDLYRDIHRWLSEDTLITFSGRIENRQGQLQWILSHVGTFREEDWQVDEKRRLFIKITEANDYEALLAIQATAGEHPGRTPVMIYNQKESVTYRLSHAYLLEPDEACLEALRRRFGSANVVMAENEDNSHMPE